MMRVMYSPAKSKTTRASWRKAFKAARPKARLSNLKVKP